METVYKGNPFTVQILFYATRLNQGYHWKNSFLRNFQYFQATRIHWKMPKSTSSRPKPQSTGKFTEFHRHSDQLRTCHANKGYFFSKYCQDSRGIQVNGKWCFFSEYYVRTFSNLSIFSVNETNSQLTTVIGQLRTLTLLDLSHNSLSQLPEEIGQLTNLSSLIGVSNSLICLPASIGNLLNLRSLHMNGNKLSRISPEICKCKFLTDVYLEANALRQVPEELTQLHYLRHVNVASNDLRQLPILPFISEVKAQ